MHWVLLIELMYSQVEGYILQDLICEVAGRQRKHAHTMIDIHPQQHKGHNDGTAEPSALPGCTHH